MLAYVTAYILLYLHACTDLYNFVHACTMLYRLVQCYTDLYNVVQTCKCKTVMFHPCAFQRNAHRWNFNLGVRQTEDIKTCWAASSQLKNGCRDWQIMAYSRI